ncbi:MAG TPA: amino acid transporter, partial [Chloroflexota bacterium]|nr:amino acid transporter [Chloroflexota bacterium]
RVCNGLPPEQPVLFLEVAVCDPSEFAPRLQVHGEEIAGYRVLHAQSATVPNAIAAFLLYLRDRSGSVPHAYFTWTEGNTLKNMLGYLLFGEGDIAPIANEVLREAEPDPWRRPIIHVA